MARDDPQSTSDLKKRCIRRLEGLKPIRRPFETDWTQLASLGAPARSRFLGTSDTNKGRKPNRRLNNSHGIFAFRTLQGGMTSGLSSQSRPWFTLTAHDEAMAEHPEVKAHLGEVERRMYAFIAQTNLYGTLKTGYLELGLFGTEAGLAMDHRKVGMYSHALTAGEYWLTINDANEIGGMYRECVMSALQSIQTFGLDGVSPRIKQSYDKSNYEDLFTFYHAVEENEDFESGLLGWRGKPWRSIYWEDTAVNTGTFAQLTGFFEKPFWAPRWDTTGNDTYGQGPGHDALPDLRELQMQVKRKGEATDLLIWPEIVSTGKTKLKRQPKSVVNSAEIDATKVTNVPYQTPPQAVQFVREDIVDLKEAINQATFADLFMAITNMAGVQPRNIEEIAARNEEKLTQLGPVIERVNNEKLAVVIQRVYGIMSRAQMLPTPPDILRNAPEIKIEFVSILTQMQRMVGLGQIERTSNFIGSISAVYPDARHKLDFNATIDEYAQRSGMPMKLIRSTEDAEADADAEAQAAQNAQMAAAAGSMAKPFKDMTDAAKVASTIPGSGVPPTQDLVPLVPR